MKRVKKTRKEKEIIIKKSQWDKIVKLVNKTDDKVNVLDKADFGTKAYDDLTISSVELRGVVYKTDKEKQEIKERLVEVYKLGFYHGVNFVDMELGDCIADKINQFEEQEGIMPSGKKVANYDRDKEVGKEINRKLKALKY